MNKPQRFAQAKATAQYLGISTTTFWRLAANNPSFPKPKSLVGSVKVYDLREVDAFVLKAEKNGGINDGM